LFAERGHGVVGFGGVAAVAQCHGLSQ
jgi:hypothetical protein